MKKTISALLIGGLAAIGIVASPMAASAHTGDLDVTAVCNTATGQYDLTATLTISQTGLNGETWWKVGSENFTGTPNSSSDMDRGPVASSGAGTITLGTFSIPGTTTSKGPWVYAFTKWTDGFPKGSDGQLRQNLKGDCKLPKPTQPNPLSGNDVISDNPVCVEPRNGTATVKTTTTSWTQEYVWSDSEGAWVLGSKTYGQPVITESTIDSEQCTPVVVPPRHNANGEDVCGAATITLYNQQYDGEVSLTASFVVYVDGKFYNAYAVESGKSQTLQFNFPEDSGNHSIIVRTGPAQGDEFVYRQDVTNTDCIPPKPDNKVTYTEWKTGEFVCGDTTAQITREATSTEYILVEGEWVPEGESVTVPQTETRDLTAEEIEALNCEVIVPPTEEPAKAPDTGETLAATGGTDVLGYGILGSILLAIGAIIVVARRIKVDS